MDSLNIKRNKNRQCFVASALSLFEHFCCFLTFGVVAEKQASQSDCQIGYSIRYRFFEKAVQDSMVCHGELKPFPAQSDRGNQNEAEKQSFFEMFSGNERRNQHSSEKVAGNINPLEKIIITQIGEIHQN